MKVYTDGACSGNPGPGGWAWVIADGRHGSGGEIHTTNQRMEVAAVLEALRALEGPIDIVSDSTYVVKCFNDRWYEGWLKRGWKNSQKKPVANRDLWEPLIEEYLARQDEITFTWVKGHSGDPMNDEADRLAVEAAEEQKLLAAGGATGAASAPASLAASPAAPPWPADRAVWVVGSTDPDSDERAQLARAIDAMRSQDVMVSGLRRGVELDAARAGEARGIPLAVVLPFADPAAKWPAVDRSEFDRQIERADWVVTLGGKPQAPGEAVAARNAWIGEHIIGAVVIGDDQLARQLDDRGVAVVGMG